MLEALSFFLVKVSYNQTITTTLNEPRIDICNSEFNLNGNWQVHIWKVSWFLVLLCFPSLFNTSPTLLVSYALYTSSWISIRIQLLWFISQTTTFIGLNYNITAQHSFSINFPCINTKHSEQTNRGKLRLSSCKKKTLRNGFYFLSDEAYAKVRAVWSLSFKLNYII